MTLKSPIYTHYHPLRDESEKIKGIYWYKSNDLNTKNNTKRQRKLVAGYNNVNGTLGLSECIHNAEREPYSSVNELKDNSRCLSLTPTSLARSISVSSGSTTPTPYSSQTSYKSNHPLIHHSRTSTTTPSTVTSHSAISRVPRLITLPHSKRLTNQLHATSLSSSLSQKSTRSISKCSVSLSKFDASASSHSISNSLSKHSLEVHNTSVKPLMNNCNVAQTEAKQLRTTQVVSPASSSKRFNKQTVVLITDQSSYSSPSSSSPSLFNSYQAVTLTPPSPSSVGNLNPGNIAAQLHARRQKAQASAQMLLLRQTLESTRAQIKRERSNARRLAEFLNQLVESNKQLLDIQTTLMVQLKPFVAQQMTHKT